VSKTGTNREVVKSTCALCLALCGVLIHMEDGKPVKIVGDPDSPVNRGALCIKARRSFERLFHPDRLKYPLKRSGERGEGKWQRITWDEALDTIADKFLSAKEKYGPESIWIHMGNGKHMDWYVERLGNAFGVPNVSWYGQVCWGPRLLGANFTNGFLPLPDYEYPPACLVIWGCNMEETRIVDAMNTREAVKRGSKLIVIDPREIQYVKEAILWLKVRPGSDLALALGMINVIINEGLYDKDFVVNWTVGFDQLKRHVQDYSAEKVEEITWVPAEKIKEAARLYATTKPAAIQWGNALDHGINAFQSCRAVSILRAITGNLCVPGGELKWRKVPVMERFDPAVGLGHLMPPEVAAKRLWWQPEGRSLVNFTTPSLVVKAILENKPYHIAAGYIHGANLLLTSPNAQEVYKALMKIDFFAASDLFMTPTAALADIVLPAASYLEYDFVDTPPYYPIAAVQQKVAQIEESWPDHKIMNELAKKLGIGEHFWKDENEALDTMLAPSGMTFEEFKKVGIIPGVKEYRQYKTEGFPTSSGKVELYSQQLGKLGKNPLPVYYEPANTPQGTPELAKEYPLLFTVWKPECYRHSDYRNISSLRAVHPEPVVEIHSETARKLGIKEGDWVHIETKLGRIKQRASLTSAIDPRVVIADYGWWFPEKGISELYGWQESNINVLIDDEPPYGYELGTPNLRGIRCKVYKIED